MNLIKLLNGKFSIVLTLATIFIALTNVWGQEKAIVPIATDHYLLGGVKDGKWLTANTVVPTMGKKTKMLLVNLIGVSKTNVILTVTGEENGACPENKLMRLEPEIESGFAIGANADWKLVPRTPKLLRLKDKTYRKIAADFLNTKGIAKSKIVLNQIVRIDLEGDGQTEVLLTGNFYKKGLMEDQTVGDYSFAILRKTVGGKAKNILIDGEFFTKRGAYDPPNERKILAVADLNGDGRMEIVLDTSYYEGSWKQVFEVNGTKVAKVLEASCLV